MFVKVLLSCGCCRDGGKGSHLAGGKLLSSQSVTALSQCERTLGCLRKRAGAPWTAWWMCTCSDAVPRCLGQEQDVMPTRPLPLRAQLGVTALAGFLDSLWGLFQKVHWRYWSYLYLVWLHLTWVFLLFLLALRWITGSLVAKHNCRGEISLISDPPIH